MTELLPALFLALGYLLLFGCTEALHRLVRVPVEWSRKFMHVAGGLLSLLLPVLFSTPYMVLALAAAFGVHQQRLSFALSGLCSAFAAVAGIFVALISTLAPSQIWSWLGVIFAVVIIGRLGNPIGLLIASMAIGAAEGLAMAVFSPAWAPMVSFSILIVVLLWQPKWL